tara:strand:+ start:333 stop:470 length:138 start_codon:yes stop_codon:yes gene_type:complete
MREIEEELEGKDSAKMNYRAGILNSLHLSEIVGGEGVDVEGEWTR